MLISHNLVESIRLYKIILYKIKILNNIIIKYNNDNFAIKTYVITYSLCYIY